MAENAQGGKKSFLFRELHQRILIGTASDRYAGWIGHGRKQRKAHGARSVGQSVTEYFEHFPLLEIDYTFYRLLLQKDSKPPQNFHILKNYRQHMKDGDLLLLKAPQVIIARKLRGGAGFVRNVG
ncbi:MAG: DUF72 domain-containing protein [Deltaproteobacteria bacterium]|nr:DUF72 domain-containing protein [Deltaproteobacteria bacterium]